MCLVFHQRQRDQRHKKFLITNAIITEPLRFPVRSYSAYVLCYILSNCAYELLILSINKLFIVLSIQWELCSLHLLVQVLHMYIVHLQKKYQYLITQQGTDQELAFYRMYNFWWKTTILILSKNFGQNYLVLQKSLKLFRRA